MFYHQRVIKQCVLLLTPGILMPLQIQEGGFANQPDGKIFKYQILPELTFDLLEWRWTDKLSGSDLDSTERGKRRRSERRKAIFLIVAALKDGDSP